MVVIRFELIEYAAKDMPFDKRLFFNSLGQTHFTSVFAFDTGAVRF